MRVRVLLALAVSSIACSSSATFPVAMGGEHRLPEWNGPCDASTVRPEGIVRFGKANVSAFTAVAEGDAKIRCERGVLVMRVRRVARLEIEGPATASLGAKTFYTAIGWSADNERLALGDGVEWKLDGPAHAADRCSHMLGTCAEAWQQPLVGDAAGPLTIRASVAGITATRVIAIR